MWKQFNVYWKLTQLFGNIKLFINLQLIKIYISGFWTRFEMWASKMCHSACSNEQFSLKKWPSTGCLDKHLAKSLNIIHHSELARLTFSVLALFQIKLKDWMFNLCRKASSLQAMHLSSNYFVNRKFFFHLTVSWLLALAELHKSLAHLCQSKQNLKQELWLGYLQTHTPACAFALDADWLILSRCNCQSILSYIFCAIH